PAPCPPPDLQQRPADRCRLHPSPTPEMSPPRSHSSTAAPASQRHGGWPQPAAVSLAPSAPPAPGELAGLDELVAETEQVHMVLGEAHARLGRLLAALKQLRCRDRVVAAALASLRPLPPLSEHQHQGA